MKKRHNEPQPQSPGYQEIADLAVALASDEHDLGPGLRELFYWPAAATPVQDPRKLFLPIVEKYKRLAEESLRQHYEHYHLLACRRERWHRTHTRKRSVRWARPHARPQSPRLAECPRPRIRSHLPGSVRRGGLSPPRAIADRPEHRPGWRDTERLLFFFSVFDK